MRLLDESVSLPDGVVRWRRFPGQEPVVLVHGTPYSSFLWRDIGPALNRRGREVFVFDHLGYGTSDMEDGQDLSIAAQARNFVRLIGHWGLERPEVVACDIGGAIVLRALLLEGLSYSRLTLFDAVTGGEWEHGLFALIREHYGMFEALPAHAHRALVTAHLEHGTARGYRPGVLETFREPWLGSDGQAAFYRQYRQLAQTDTADYEHLLDEIAIDVELLWGREDQILPRPYAEWIQARVKNRGLTWIDHAGHLLPEDAPAQLMERLLV